MASRTVVIWLLAVMAAVAAMAQNYTITAEVEPVVSMGDRFHLNYVVNTADITQFTLGQMPDALLVTDGPERATSISTATVDGQLQTISQLRLTYELEATATGLFTIPPATARVGTETISSDPLTVKVVTGSRQQAAAADDEFFLTAIASKRRVALGEPFLLTYKVCWSPGLTVVNLDPVLLELQDFYMLPYNDTQEKTRKTETVNGRKLVTTEWQQYVVWPVKAGRLQIPAIQTKGYYHEETPFDTFDPLAAGYHEPTRQLTAPALAIQVDELPEKPADFSGAVGRFAISARLSSSAVAADAPVSLVVTVGGKGNFSLMKAPVVTFPRGFNTYDTRQTDHYRLTAEGLEGSIDYEFTAVPQRRGAFTIPPATLTYYDLDSHSYKTLQTESLHVDVVKGDGSSTESTTARPGDILPIREGGGEATTQLPFFASAGYFLILAAIIMLAAVLFILLRRRSRHQADAERARRRQANKVAVRRMRKAQKLMNDRRHEAFYDETLRALWGYVSDKLNIPVSQLSRKNISQQLQEHGVEEQLTRQFIEAIDECEFVRYAPGDIQGSMARVYQKAINAIEKIENIKRTKTSLLARAPVKRRQ